MSAGAGDVVGHGPQRPAVQVRHGGGGVQPQRLELTLDVKRQHVLQRQVHPGPAAARTPFKGGQRAGYLMLFRNAKQKK